MARSRSVIEVTGTDGCRPSVLAAAIPIDERGVEAADR
jgi:hypothetical protein